MYGNQEYRDILTNPDCSKNEKLIINDHIQNIGNDGFLNNFLIFWNSRGHDQECHDILDYRIFLKLQVSMNTVHGYNNDSFLTRPML